jgi:hypothetical protein
MSYDNQPSGQNDETQGYATPQGYGAPPPAYGQPSYGQPSYGQPPYGQPGPGYPGPAYGAPLNDANRPPTYAGWATTAAIAGIFFSLILGLPTALVARFYGRKVRSAWAAGQLQAAAQASRRALIWVIISLSLDVLSFILFVTVIAHPATSTG